MNFHEILHEDRGVADDRAGAPLRYRVKVVEERSRSPGSVMWRTVPQLNFLRSSNPLPFGTGRTSRGWGPMSTNPLFLPALPLYDSEVLHQVQELPADSADGRTSRPTPQQSPLSSQPRPMSLTRRLKGCLLLLLLSLISLLIFRALLDSVVDTLQSSISPSAIVSFVFGYIVFITLTIAEVRYSQLAWILKTDVAALDRGTQLLDQGLSSTAPVINFKVLNDDRKLVKEQWLYDRDQDVSPPMYGIMSHIAQLSSKYQVVRLRLPVSVSLADDQTKEDFIAALQRFHLRWPSTKLKHNNLTVEVLPRGRMVAVVRSGVNPPLHFRVLRIIFRASMVVSLSWVVRIVVLLFMPHLVDPAYSPVYCHRKRLVARATRA